MIDYSLQFCDAQDETTVDTHISDNIVDTLVAGDALNELYFVARVETACTSGGSATVQVKLVTDAASTMDTGPTVVFSTDAIAVASLVDKYLFCCVRLPKPSKLARYLGAQIIIGTAVLTAGKIDAYLTDVPVSS